MAIVVEIFMEPNGILPNKRKGSGIMQEIEAKIQHLQQEEQELTFSEFNSDIAWNLGCFIVKRAREKAKKPVAVGISMNHHDLFYYAFDGTTPDNDAWIRRKQNSIYRFFKSTYQLALYMELKQDTIFNRYAVAPTEYAQFGGGFPVRVASLGVIGAIAVSGMTDREDHQFVTEAVREFLSGKV